MAGAEAENIKNMRILLFPYLATGHITPFIELAKNLTDRGFSIDLCSTQINFSFMKKKLTNKYISKIQLVEFRLPDLPELPPHYHTTNGLPFHLKEDLYKAINMSKPDLQRVLNDRKPHLLIYDSMILWASGAASELNIPAIQFYICAAAFTYFDHLFFNRAAEFPFPDIYLLGYELERIACFNLAAAVEEQVDKDKLSELDAIVLVDSSREIDAKYVDYLRKERNIKIVPLGARFHEDDEDEDTEETELIKWLHEKEEHSTVFVSFGSESFLTKEELEEVAYGLELSGVHFIWVVRFETGKKIELREALPLGFLERIGERGRVVEGWAPQTRILKHQSIGGFVSHCGWNSMIESIEHGVPIIAMPMHNIDQSLTARLMKGIGVAVEIARNDDGTLNRVNIAANIKDVMGEETGKNLREKMNSLHKNMRLQKKEEMDGAIEVIKQICEKNSPSKNA